MGTQVTKRDLARFASLGFQASVCANGETDSGSLVESVVRALQAPSARLAGAVMMVLHNLAESDELERVLDVELDDDVRRRLGYLAERLSQTPASSDVVARRLEAFAERLAARSDSSRPPLTFLAKTNPTMVRLQMNRGDETSRSWNVFGNVKLPEPPTV